MPTLNATSLPYSGAPTTQIPVEPPNDFQRIQASPEAFGALEGRATSQLGQTLDQAGNTLAQITLQRQNLFNEVAATDASNQWIEESNKILRGDPAKPGDTGFYGKQGEDALRAFPQVRDQLDKLYSNLRGGLQNLNQQLHFDSNTRRLHAYALSDAGTHYDKENKVWTQKTFDSRAKLYNQQGSAMAAANDFSAFQDSLAGEMQAKRDLLKSQGLASPENLQLSDKQVLADGVKKWTQQLALEDPNKALKFLEMHSDDIIHDEYIQLHHQLDQKATLDRGKLYNQGDFTGPALRRGGAILPSTGQPHLNYGSLGMLGNPNAPDFEAKNITTITSPSGVPFRVHKAAADDAKGFLNDLEATGYKINSVESGGYNKRPMRDSDTMSEHGYGTALDINSTQNLYTRDGRRVTNLPANVGQIAAKHNFEWGGEWTDPIDAMHFQWIGSNRQLADNNFGGIRAPGPERGKAAGGFQSYSTPEAGVRAITDNLKRYSAGGVATAMNPSGAPLNTLRGIVTTWAPPNQNNTQQLIQRAVDTTGFGPDQVLDMNDPAVLAKTTEAIIRNEQGGRLPVSTDLISKVVGGGPDTIVQNRVNMLPRDPDLLPDKDVPGLVDHLNWLARNVPQNDRAGFESAVKQARQQYNAAYMDRQRQHQMQQQALKDTAFKAETGLYDRFAKGDIPTPDQVASALKGSAPEKIPSIVGFFNREMSEGPVPSGTSHNNLVDIIGKIQNQEITDPTVVTQAYSPGRLVNYDDWQRALKALKDRHDPGQAAVQNSFADLRKSLEPAIYGPNYIKDMLSKEQHMRMYQWHQDVQELIGDYQKSGKNPTELFNYKSPNFVGSDEFIKKYAPTLNETIKKDAPAKGPDLSSEEAIIRAYRLHQIDEAGLIAAGKALGMKWKTEPVTTPIPVR